jgi:hypothetical protein
VQEFWYGWAEGDSVTLPGQREGTQNVTLHVVLGDGEMTRRELTQTLTDLQKAAESEDQNFWFLLQGKSEPSDTDTALVSWLEKNEIYYEVVTDDPESMSGIYTQPQDTHTAKKISQKVVSLLQSKPEENETAEILALFSDVNDATAAEDRWLNGVIQAAFDAGYSTRALNDGLVEIDLSETAAETEEEPPTKAAPTKTTTKTPTKAAAKAPISGDDEADMAISEEDEDVSSSTLEGPGSDQPVVAVTTTIPTRAELEDMEPSQVKAVAASLGIVLAPRTRATTYIDHILGETKAAAPTAEVEEVATTNGNIDLDALAEKTAALLWERIQKAFANV